MMDDSNMSNPFDEFDNSNVGQPQGSPQTLPQGQMQDSSNTSNPFDQFDQLDTVAPAEQQQPVRQSAQTQNEFGYSITDNLKATLGEAGDSFMAGVTAWNRHFDRLMGGATDLFLTDNASKKLHEYDAAAEKDYNKSYEAHPFASLIGAGAAEAGMGYLGGKAVSGIASGMGKAYNYVKGIGSVAPTVAEGTAAAVGGVAAKASAELPAATVAISEAVAKHPLASMLGQSSAASAAQGYLGMADNQSQRLEHSAVAGLLGLAIPAATTALWNAPKIFFQPAGKASYLKQMFNPKAAAVENTAAELADAGATQQFLDDALAPSQKLGTVTPTPSQALGTMPGVAQKTIEQNLQIPSDLKKSVQVGKYQAQDAFSLKATKDTIANMASPEDKAAVAFHYSEELPKLNLPEEVTTGLSSNPVIAPVLDNVKNYSSKAVRDLPDTSAVKWWKAKQEIDDLLYNDTYGSPAVKGALGHAKKSGLTEAANEINQALDNAFPQHEVARRLAQKVALQEKLGLTLQKVNTATGNRTDAIYNKMFNSDVKQAYFLDEVGKAAGKVGSPEYIAATQHAKDVITVIQQVRKTSLKNQITNSAVPDQGVYSGGSKSGWIQRGVEKLTNNQYDRAMVQLMLDPTWAEQVKQVWAKEATGSTATKWMELLKNALYKSAPVITQTAVKPAVETVSPTAEQSGLFGGYSDAPPSMTPQGKGMFQ